MYSTTGGMLISLAKNVSVRAAFPSRKSANHLPLSVPLPCTPNRFQSSSELPSFFGSIDHRRILVDVNVSKPSLDDKAQKNVATFEHFWIREPA